MCNNEQWQMLTIWDVTSFSFSNVCWVLYMFEICMWLEKKLSGWPMWPLFYFVVLFCKEAGAHLVKVLNVWNVYVKVNTKYLQDLFDFHCLFFCSSHMQCKYLRFLSLISAKNCIQHLKQLWNLSFSLYFIL